MLRLIGSFALHLKLDLPIDTCANVTVSRRVGTKKYNFFNAHVRYNKFESY